MAKSSTISKPATPAATTPAAQPSDKVAPMGRSVKGAHIRAWRACKGIHWPVDPATTIEYVPGQIPWKIGCDGYAFYEAVVARNPSNLGAALKLAEGKFKPVEVYGHLRWLYTMARLKVGGKLWVDTPLAKAVLG